MSEECKLCGFPPRAIILFFFFFLLTSGHEGGDIPPRAAPARAEWARAQSSSEASARPLGSARRETPRLVPHMAVLPRREGRGEAPVLLNK